MTWNVYPSEPAAEKEEYGTEGWVIYDNCGEVEVYAQQQRSIQQLLLQQ